MKIALTVALIEAFKGTLFFLLRPPYSLIEPYIRLAHEPAKPQSFHRRPPIGASTRKRLIPSCALNVGALIKAVYKGYYKEKM